MPGLREIYSWISISTDEDEIVEALLDMGPLSALLDDTQLQYYKGCIWSGYRDGGSAMLGCKQVPIVAFKFTFNENHHLGKL